MCAQQLGISFPPNNFAEEMDYNVARDKELEQRGIDLPKQDVLTQLTLEVNLAIKAVADNEKCQHKETSSDEGSESAFEVDEELVEDGNKRYAYNSERLLVNIFKFQCLSLCASTRISDSAKEACQHFASKYYGVYFLKRCNKFVAKVYHKGKNYNFGCYILAADGAMAYDVGVKVIKGSDLKKRNFVNDTEYTNARTKESSQRGLVVPLADIVKSIKTKKKQLRSKVVSDNKSTGCTSNLHCREEMNASQGTESRYDPNIEKGNAIEHQPTDTSKPTILIPETNTNEKLHKPREISAPNTRIGVLAAIASKVDTHARPEATLSTERIKKKTKR